MSENLEKENPSVFDLYCRAGLLKLYVCIGSFSSALEVVNNISYEMMS